MKTIKNAIVLTLLFCLVVNFSFAQQMFRVHQDNVRPSSFMEYEKVAKKFRDACIKYNVDVTWFAASTNDFKYIYVSPIENFAELDERPFAEMAEAMGDDFSDMFKEFDKHYDSHGTYILVKDSELSYMPEGVENAPSNENYRTWIYMYYKPEHAKDIREGMKAVKQMFKDKGSTRYYRVYRDGLGQTESYYLVSLSAENEIDSAKKDTANRETLGPDRWDTFNKVMKYVTRTEEYTGRMRPDMDYAPKTE
ncbi:hypothetical protein KFZ70_12840 [Tamlana fucoidanivorans]|uniref:Uncharacterized protein n=1 Tax=Allotamlana fucoidanivorans TaxID=2583814 RepID=A0A5C4SE96_9FLAO|nr:hypothetical protein [Tamlana fucoidanivorans]TNJ41715.1 hypothetical protein FGF67_15655 [Tamlana fucoidanivorans]